VGPGQRLAAAGRHAKLRQRYPQARAIVYGHSHHLVADRDALPWVLNPGAAGRTRTYGGPSCMVIEATDSDWRLSIHRFPLPALRRRKLSGSPPISRADSG
jgi:predicted phosphodiesterase